MEENTRHIYSKSKEHYSDAWGKHCRLNATQICEESTVHRYRKDEEQY